MLARGILNHRRHLVKQKIRLYSTLWTPMRAQDAMKRKHPGGDGSKKKKARGIIDWKDGSHDSVLQLDVLEKMASLGLDLTQAESTTQAELTTEAESTPQAGLARDEEVILKVDELSSTGDGLAYDDATKSIFVVPYTLPGDVVRARVARHARSEIAQYIFTDLVEVTEPSPDRDDKLIECKYFATCSGCQFQMLSYPKQLQHKRQVIEKAYKNFSNIEPKQIPEVGETIASPLQYGYRTKLTPHFDGPPGRRSDRRNGIFNQFTEVPPIGFMLKNYRTTIDIEDCPIGTEAIRRGMKRERERVKNELDTFRRGATILLRENTRREHKNADGGVNANKQNLHTKSEVDAVREEFPKHFDYHTCVTDPKGTTTEYIDDFTFRNLAGAFFQNNNSILPVFTQYVREQALHPRTPDREPQKLKYLIDAYCGSGLFSITLASMFEETIGIDIDEGSIASAEKNARRNNIPASKATFIAADAKQLFAQVHFLAEESVAIIDPPRKGCDMDFLRQLMAFGPSRIVYVSCNVHTQAKDVGVLVNGINGQFDGMYDIESLRGFDFFPQTGHVEGVAILNRRESNPIAI